MTAKPDIVERLRDRGTQLMGDGSIVIGTRVIVSGDLCDAAHEITALRKRLDDAERDAAAVRELMNCYNLGGWTDSERLLKERIAAERERDEAYERAAKVCEHRASWIIQNRRVDIAERCGLVDAAAAIRALAKGET